MADFLTRVLAELSGGAGIVTIITFVFWKADSLISKSGREILEKLISQSISEPERSELRQVIVIFLKQYFSPNLPARTYVWNVAILTLASMLILLLVYMDKTEGFLAQLASDPYALQHFFTQFILNGFVVTYIVNHVAFSAYAPLIERVDLSKPSWSTAIIVLDMVAKTVLFSLATLVSYLLFAALFESFGGSPITAAHATMPTIRLALRFDNITAVYLYSVAISSLPMFLICLISLIAANQSLGKFIEMFFFWLPFEGRPMRSIAVVFGFFTVIFYQIASALIALT